MPAIQRLCAGGSHIVIGLQARSYSHFAVAQLLAHPGTRNAAASTTSSNYLDHRHHATVLPPLADMKQICDPSTSGPCAAGSSEGHKARNLSVNSQ